MIYQIGQRVRANIVVGKRSETNKHRCGTILNLRRGEYLIEFDDYIHGHEGNGVGEITGTDGHCWWLRDNDFELENTHKEIKQYGIVKFMKGEVNVKSYIE
jgi:hypothetical protein